MMNALGLPEFPNAAFSDTDHNQQVLYSFEALTPTIIDPENAQSYIEALNFACSRPDIRNIAVTGPYGAGKSSVLLTWSQSPENDFRVMTVSLADFDMQKAVTGTPDAGKKEEGKDASGSIRAGAEEKSIEYSILQQLLYKEKKSALPYSRIERISDITSAQVAGMAGHLLLLLSMAVVGLLFLFPDYIRAKLSLPPLLSQFLLSLPTLIRLTGAGAFLFAAFFLMLKKLHRIGLFDRRVSVDKIDMLKGAITTRPSAPSLLNIYIDEIVYFFEQTEHDVVIFEDLDRHNDGAIFIKLREINQIINNCLPADKPVRFIYAVRDELFSTPESRTKFFDFVMPVIPVMDSENASEHFSGKFTDDELSQAGFRECLNRLSVFIPDMRVMHNIANEFRLYRNIVNNGEDLKRLVSLIAYKNLCAGDYHGIDQKKGVLYGVVAAHTSGELRRIHEDKLHSEITSIKSNMAIFHNEEASEKDEIRKDILKPYISEITSKTVYFFIRNNMSFSLEDVVRDESIFLSLISGTQFYVRVRHYDIDIATIDSTTAQQMKAIYDERCERLRLKSGGHLSQLQTKIESLNRDIRMLYACDLAYFIDRMGSSGFADWVKENYAAVSGSDVLADKSPEQVDFMYFLLRNGYLATDYMSYRSVFMPGSLSVEDNNFIRAVSAGKASDETTVMPLNKVANVVIKLRGLGMQLQENAWHPQVLLHLLRSDRILLQEIVKMQSELGEEHRLVRLAEEVLPQWELVDTRAYMQLLASDDGQLASLIRQLTQMRETAAERYLLALLLCVPDLPWITPSQDTQIELRQLLSGYYDLTESVPAGCAMPFTENLKKTGNILWHIPLSESETGRQVIRAAAEGDLWAYSAPNLLNIYLSLAPGTGDCRETFRQKPLSSIKSLEIINLNACLDRNISAFIRDIFTDSSETEIIQELLNSEMITWRDAECIVTKMNFIMDDLAEIKNMEGERLVIQGENHRRNLYSILINYERVNVSLQQFLFLLEESANISGDVLCNWLNRNHTALMKECIPLSDELFTQLLLKIIVSENITMEALTYVTETFSVVLTTVPDNIMLENVAVLISQKRLAPTATVFEELYQAFHEVGHKLNLQLCELIYQWPALLNQDRELVLYTELGFDRALAVQLMNSTQLSESVRADSLNWLWVRDPALFGSREFLSLETLDRLAPLLMEDAFRHMLLIQCLKAGEFAPDTLRRILMAFSDPAYTAFLVESNYRRIQFSDAMWQLAVLLETGGFISRASKSHGDTSIRIEPFGCAEDREE